MKIESEVGHSLSGTIWRDIRWTRHGKTSDGQSQGT